MVVLQSIIDAAKDHGIAGIACISLGIVVKWLDGRISRVETECDKTSGAVQEIRENVAWMRDRMENGKR